MSSRSERFFVWAEATTDWLNPILVKETRQALKSRQFIATFFLLLIVAWLISAGGVLWAGPAIEYGTAGRTLFVFYFYALSFAALFVVPLGAFHSMLRERDQNTYELLSISTLSPRQIVWGKLCSALVQIMIYYSAIAPFVAFTSLLQGFDLALTLLLLTAGLFWATCVTMVAIMLSTLSDQKQWQAITSLGTVVLLVSQFGSVLGLTIDTLNTAVRYNDPDFWWGLAGFAVASTTYFWLSLHIAVSRLTFESDNRSTWIRIVCSVQFWCACSSLAVYHLAGGGTVDESMIGILAAVVVCHWCVVGTFAATESEYLSRRIRRTFSDKSLLRWLQSVWIPGGSRGLVYVFAHLAVVGVLVEMTTDSNSMMWVHAAVLYVACYVGFGAFVGRFAHAITPDFRPVHTRLLMLLMACFAMVAPLIIQATGIGGVGSGYSFMKISNPFQTLPFMARVADLADNLVILKILGVAAAMAVLLNARAMSRGIFGVVPYRPV